MGSLELLQELRENVQDVSLDDQWDDMSSIYETKSNNDNIWLVSFTDVIALMLVFFVMMFSMSHPKENGWITIVQSLNMEFHGGVENQRLAGNYGVVDMKRLREQKILNTSYLFSVLKSLKEKKSELKIIKMEGLSKKVRLTFDYNDIYQNDTSLEMTSKGREAIDVLIKNIGHLQNSMDIVLGAQKSNIDMGLKQTAKISEMFKKAGYEGNITLSVAPSDHKNMALFIHSAK